MSGSPLTGMRLAMEDLFKGVQVHTDAIDDRAFFKAIGDQLNTICAEISKLADADSCAVYFVTDDPSPEGGQRLIMRGAWGNLRATLNHGLESEMEPGDPACYESVVQQPLAALSGCVRLTHVVWHCGLARWANTRDEMDRLRRGSSGGAGDPYAYPGPTLDKVFRNCVIVPIFAPGRVSAACSQALLEALVEASRGFPPTPEELQKHLRFLRDHRVVGVLKLENKQPRVRAGAAEFEAFELPFEAGCQERMEPFGCPSARSECCTLREQIVGGIQHLTRRELAENLYRQMTAMGADPTPLNVAEGPGWNQVCGELVDHCTRTFDATFSNQDVELLVTMAMQLGRILPWRTIQYASRRRLSLDESEVGSLLIRSSDVDDLELLFRATEYALHRVRFAIEQLRSDLAFEHQRGPGSARRWGIASSRDPIRNVTHRSKALSHLLRKAIIRHDEASERARHDPAEAGIAEGAELLASRPLVLRLLGPEKENLYNIRDIAGVRVTCDYLSDIRRVVDAICSCCDVWGIIVRDKQDSIGLVDDSGYRAIHLDLLVKVDRPPSAVERLKAIVSGVHDQQDTLGAEAAKWRELVLRDDELWLPCELQLRTAYEDSWATKSHDLVYKRDWAAARLPKALLDSLQILSNNLYEADRLSDIVREQIQELLTPEARDEAQLLALLSARLDRLPPREVIASLPLGPVDWPFRYANFAMDCARKLYAHHVRYNGQGHYLHALSIALALVRRFGLFPLDQPTDVDPNRLRIQRERHVAIFSLAMLHDCWLAATNDRGAITQNEREKYWSGPAVDGASVLVQECCGEVIDAYGRSIDPTKYLGDTIPLWVEPFMQEYKSFWRGELGDAERKEDQAAEFWKAIDNRGLDPVGLGDVCLLRAAMLIDRLEELPDTPNKERRRERFRAAYEGEFRSHLREHLHDVPNGRAILAELDRAFQDVAARLGVEIPIHWHE